MNPLLNIGGSSSEKIYFDVTENFRDSFEGGKNIKYIKRNHSEYRF